MHIKKFFFLISIFGNELNGKAIKQRRA